jgi:nucleoside 2-deoxyribosyltransferase
MERLAMNCPVCQHPAATNVPTDRDGTQITCLRCGSFFISGLVEAELGGGEYEDDRWKISAWIRQHAITKFLSNDLDRAANATPPSNNVRAERVLFWLYRNFPSFGYRYSRESLLEDDKYACLLAIGWCKDTNELQALIDEYLIKREWLSVVDNNQIIVSEKGVEHLESSKNHTDSRIGFCAMWFDDEVKSAWTDAIEPGIREAGWEPLRVDGVEHAGKIDDQIVESIRQSRFVVADFTGHRGGVYFEAGLAQGLGIPVIWTCRDDCIKDLHFDIRQYNCVVWKNDDFLDFKSRLTNRIVAVLGRGPNRVADGVQNP